MLASMLKTRAKNRHLAIYRGHSKNSLFCIFFLLPIRTV